MVEIQRILCPVDFSDASRHALEHAVAIARFYRSQVTALHVVNPALLLGPPVVFFAEPAHGLAPTPMDRQAQEKRLAEWLTPAVAAGLQTDARVDDGDPVRVILHCAASIAADLIVLGTHGRGGVERFILGSVTEKVLRKAECPVLTVPPPAAAAPALPYARILCPIDFSESSLSAFRFAASLANHAGARLTLLHVFERSADEDLVVQRFDTIEYRRVMEQQARHDLEALVTDEMRRWCRPELHVGYGKPYRQILEFAERDAFNVIVMGVRGRNPLDTFLFGSTTNHVVRRAACPVLTLKS